MSFQLPNAKLMLRTWLIVFLIAAAWTGLHAEKIRDLHPQGYVNDFAGVLSASAKEKLRALCAELDQKAGAQIAIVTVKSLEGESAQQYSFDLATQWGVGPKQKSRGLLILLAPGEHKYWFQVGYGLEPILPDGKVGGFGREAVPLLRQNDYDGAVLLMTQRVAAVIAEDKGVTLDALRGAPSSPSSPEPDEGSPNHSYHYNIIIFVIVIFLIRIVFSFIFRGSRTGGRRGGGGWWIGPMILGGMFRGGGGSWGGGGFGGGGGGGGGFGGFGGGSFGGGGAGGSW
jgi:uncharacterized protein